MTGSGLRFSNQKAVDRGVSPTSKNPANTRSGRLAEWGSQRRAVVKKTSGLAAAASPPPPAFPGSGSSGVYREK